MSKRVRFLIVLLVLAVSAAFLYPTFNWYFVVPQEQKDLAAGSREQIRDYAKAKAVRELDKITAMAEKDEAQVFPGDYPFLVKDARENLKAADKEFKGDLTVAQVLGAFRNQNEVLQILEDYYRENLLDLKERSTNILQLGLDLSGGMSIMLRADMESLAERLGHSPTADEQTMAMNQSIETLTNRIDRFGVTEPQIRKAGETSISIEIPGAADPERVKSFLLGKGSLGFYIVDDEQTAALKSFLAENPRVTDPAVAGALPDDLLEAGWKVAGVYNKDSYGIDERVDWVVITNEPGLDGNHLTNAQVGSDPLSGRPTTNFNIDSEGGDIFFKLTTDHKGERMAVVMDDKVKAMATIQEAIRQSVRVSGFNQEEAYNLATILRTAAMPVDLEVSSQQAIGASMGEDSIQIGLKAISFGFIAVIAFMLIWYLGAGFIADIALILNLVLIVAILSAFNLTLTLTSIAGLILTVGMAVDANVIIFERIKEEYRLGKSASASVKAGFQKAFWTVMDANITTFIAALFLSQIGSGPVQGFAITLAVGIVSSMFTALFVSRLVFDFSLETLKAKKLSIAWRK